MFGWIHNNIIRRVVSQAKGTEGEDACVEMPVRTLRAFLLHSLAFYKNRLLLLWHVPELL